MTEEKKRPSWPIKSEHPFSSGESTAKFTLKATDDASAGACIEQAIKKLTALQAVYPPTSGGSGAGAPDRDVTSTI